MDGSGWTCDHSQKSHLKELVWLREDELHQARFPFLLLLLLFILFSLVSFSIIIIITWKLGNTLCPWTSQVAFLSAVSPHMKKRELDWYCQCFSAINFKNCQKNHNELFLYKTEGKGDNRSQSMLSSGFEIRRYFIYVTFHYIYITFLKVHIQNKNY